jgi:hypothetical protein
VTTKNIKFGKVSIVLFLTVLIWVWSDLAQDERLNLPDVVLEVARSTNQTLWVAFVPEGKDPGLKTSVPLDSVVLKGPARTVAEVSRLRNRGALDLSLFLVPEQEGMTRTDTRTLDVLEFLKRSEEIRRLGLTVEACEPKRLTVRVQELVKMSAAVECVGLEPSLQVKTLTPNTVDVFVPEYEAGVRTATIRLTPEEQNRAKSAPVETTAYLELAPGQRWPVPTKVKVLLAPAEKTLIEDRVPAVLNFCFSQNTQGRYRVILEDDDPTKLAAVLVRATEEARVAYANQRAPHMLLYIRDEDRQAIEPVIEREVVFNFPQEHVRANEIYANQLPPKVRFRLEPIADKSIEPTP